MSETCREMTLDEVMENLPREAGFDKPTHAAYLELQTLRAELADAKRDAGVYSDSLDGFVAKVDALRRENEALRKGLNGIIKHQEIVGGSMSRLSYTVYIARAALDSVEGESKNHDKNKGVTVCDKCGKSRNPMMLINKGWFCSCECPANPQTARER